MSHKNILHAPVVSEKATGMSDGLNKYTFRVARWANKQQIAAVIEELYAVKIARVATAIMPGKPKSKKGQAYRTPSWKKAVVTVRDGSQIDFFATE